MPSATADLEQVASTVRRLRAERGWRQQQLADVAGVSVRAVGYIEAGRRSAYDRTYVRLARALGIPLSELLGEEN